MTDVCRLCGKDKEFLDLLDMKEYSITENVEFHCRIKLDENKLLPQSVCSFCVSNVTEFKKFSDQIREVQENLNNQLSHKIPINPESIFVVDLDESLVKNCFEETADSELKNCFLELENEKSAVKIEDLGGTSNFFEADYSSDHSVQDPDYEPDTSNRTAQKRQSESEDSEEPLRKKKPKFKPRKTRSKAKDDECLEEEEMDENLSKKKKVVRQGKLLFETADSVEKLFQDEISGSSQINQIPTLNVSEEDKNPDGTITEESKRKIKGKLWKDFQMVCEICTVEHENLFDFRAHFESSHPSEVTFSCLDCKSQTFQQVSGYVNHLISKHHEHLKLW